MMENLFAVERRFQKPQEKELGEQWGLEGGPCARLGVTWRGGSSVGLTGLTASRPGADSPSEVSR